MEQSPEWNFAARLCKRLTVASDLIDAAGGESIRGGDLAERIARFAAGLRASGLAAGDAIVLACGQRPLSALAYLATIYAGLVAVPVNERALATSGESLYRKARARAVWSERAMALDWPGDAAPLALAGDLGVAAAGAADPAALDPDALAVLMPTSGSTALARLVEVSHANLTANTEAIIRSQSLGQDERAMLVLPISYSFGASVLHSHLYQGGGVVFDSRFMFPDKVLRAIGEHRCTTFAGVPTAYQLLLERSSLASIPLDPLRRFLQAGGRLGVDQIRKMRACVPHAEFFVMYGQTEATARVTCLPPSRLDEKIGSIGIPLDNIRVRILDEHEKPVATGTTGELWVSGPSICRAYFDEPPHAQVRLRDGWLATGDMAFADADGFLWLAGRKSEFVKMRGIRVGFAEIEARVASVSGVLECAALGVEHAQAGEALALFVVAAPGATELARQIRRVLPVEWLVESIVLVPELPRNPNGKLMRARLADLPGDAQSDASRVSQTATAR